VNTTVPGTSNKDELLQKISQGYRAMRDAIGALPADTGGA